MGWIGCVHCKNFRRDFVARTFALIAAVQPILHQVSCSNEMVPKAPKHYENATKDEFRVKWVGSGAFVVKTSNATLWHELLHQFHQYGPFCTGFSAVAKRYQCTQTLRNTLKHVFGANGVDRARSQRKVPTRLRGMNFCINCTSSAHFAQVHPNITKHTKT